MEKFAAILLVAIVAMAFSASFNQAEALYLPSNRVMKRSAASSAGNHVKISSPRQKRYTDYQERASAFCTGLCMYEERKSYSECFDLCNYYWGADYDPQPTKTKETSTKSQPKSKSKTKTKNSHNTFDDYYDSLYDDYTMPHQPEKVTPTLPKESYPNEIYNQPDASHTSKPASTNLYSQSNMDIQQPLNLRVGGMSSEQGQASHADYELRKRFEILEQAKDRTDFAEKLLEWHEEEHNMKMRLMETQMQTETEQQKVIKLQHDNEELRRAMLLVGLTPDNKTKNGDGKKGRGNGKKE